MKVLFFDFDGTLYIDGAISDECRAELLRVKALGHRSILNTGRSYALVPQKVRESGLFDGMICGSAYVRLGDEVIENLTLPEHILRGAYEWAKSGGRSLYFEGVDENFSVNGDLPDAGGMFARQTLPGITKITMWCDPALVRDEDFPDLRILRFPHYAEGICRGRDKSSGMKTVLDRYGLTRADAIAFGDSENDRDMLLFAGQGVCMASAPADFDDFCVYRCRARDGVPEALKMLF